MRPANMVGPCPEVAMDDNVTKFLQLAKYSHFMESRLDPEEAGIAGTAGLVRNNSIRFRSGDMEVLRQRYEAELAEWREKYGGSQAEVARINIELENLHRDNQQLKHRSILYEGINRYMATLQHLLIPYYNGIKVKSGTYAAEHMPRYTVQ